ncbi:DNA polymerase III delta prime subunit [Streptococcus sp. DD11]|nr:DNA polymerase III delta prime subunit [Streptococcus sp. DD11]
MEILFAREMMQKKGRQALAALLQAKKMWQANVSFQNALEYMVLNERW